MVVGLWIGVDVVVDVYLVVAIGIQGLYYCTLAQSNTLRH